LGLKVENQRKYGVILNGQFFPVTNRKSWLPLRQVMENYIELLESKSTLLSAEASDASDADTPPVRVNISRTKRTSEPGTRAIDALLLAILDNGGELARAEAPTVVARYGWDTFDSVRPSAIVGMRAKRYPEWIEIGGGKFRLTPEGRNAAEQIKSVLTASAQNTEVNKATNTNEE
jgi:hypothetical protein